MKKVILSFLAVSALFYSCSNDDDGGNGEGEGSVLVTPSLGEVITGDDFSRTEGDYNNDYLDNYSTLFTRGGESSVSFSGQTTRLRQTKEIGSELKAGTAVAEIQLMFEGEEVNGSSLSAGFTEVALNGTTKIVRSKTSTSLGLFNGTNTTGQGATNVGVIDDFIEDHQGVIDRWALDGSTGVAGIVTETDGSIRYVTGKGYELDQLFAKSMSGALAYDQAINHYLNRLDDNFDGTNSFRTANDANAVDEGDSYTTMEHHWDESFGYIYGNTTGENLIYKYIDNVDGLVKFSGVEKDILEAYVTGRIAISEKDYEARDEQVSILREKLGLIIAVRAVYYLGSGADKIGDLEADATGRIDAFHTLSEGYGFVHSLRYIVDGDGEAYFTDAEVDSFLATMDAENGLWSVTSDDLLDIADDIAAKSVGGSTWEFEDVVN